MRRLLMVFVVLAALVAAALPVAAAPPQGDDKWALIIGVDDHIGRTRDNIGAVGDANAFRQLLQKDGWREDRIRVLTDGAATADGIRQGMQWLVQNCNESSY
ncbi:MAG TPA: caspase family protein [Actinomycetota bacterium]|nr:caspase family protein [Actinomycetota bacterium]